MSGEMIIKDFFSKMYCSACESSFCEESISVLREESNYTVVRVCCENCGKNIGIAMLGLDRENIQKTLELSSGKTKPEAENPICYDEVIDAHQFFKALGSDWSKHIPENPTS